MQVGAVGLGRMGGNIGRRLGRSGHECVVFDRIASAISALAGHNVTGVDDIGQLCQRLKKPEAVWVMLPAGEATEAAVDALGAVLEAGDSLIDGGNAFYKDDIRRARALKAKGIDSIDCGTSGGVWGLERGYSTPIGGTKDAVERLDPIFSALAPGKGVIVVTPGRGDRDLRVECGYRYCGPSGAGRFVKMVLSAMRNKFGGHLERAGAP